MTRQSNWGIVNKFLNMLPEYSVVIDVGCGNGKYLVRNDLLYKVFFIFFKLKLN